MKRTEFAILAGLILSVIISSFSAFAMGCEGVRDEVLRLHILANSDSSEDQALKLSVRDAILEHSGQLFDGGFTLDEAKDAAEAALPEIERIARAKIEAKGFSYDVEASISETYFETRKYDNYTLPAGNYSALQIKIGKAEGKNWWCVLFPALCIPAAQNSTQAEDVFSQSEMDTVTNPRYEAKFAIVEFFEALKNRK